MKQPIKMTPGDDTHLSLLMAPHSLNLAVGQLREQLLGYGRAAFVAGHAQLRASTPEAAEDLIEEIIERISDHAVKVISHHEARKQGDTEQIESARQAVFQADDWIKRDLRILAMRPSSNPGASHCLYQIQEPATKTEALAHYSQQAILAMDEAAPAAVAVPAEVTGLLEALESMVDVCEGHDFDGAPSDAHIDKARVAISAYRAALAATPAATAQARGGELNQFLSAAKDAGITHLPMSFGEALRELEAATGTVVLPEPVAAESRFTSFSGDRWKWCTVEHAQAFGQDKGYEVRYLYTEQQVRALLAGVSAPAAVALEPRPTDAAFLAWWEPYELSDHWFVELHKIARDAWNAALNSPQAQADARDADGMYYLQDARHCAMVGNCPSFWRPGGNGYTTNLDEAERFTFEEAMKQHQRRETDLPWRCSEVDKLRRPTVDCQYMPRSWDAQRESIAAIAAAKGKDQ